MRVKKPSIGLMATLAILAAILFMTSTRAAAQEKVLHTFLDNGVDGTSPAAGLIFDAAGNLYGTTSSGGSTSDGGTVFELSPGAGGTWTEKVLWSFDNGTDGKRPQAGLTFDAAGNLYGTTYLGGTSASGTVFKLTPAGGGTWTEKVLWSFGAGTDGVNPQATLVFDAAGNLYGTTAEGGTFLAGTVFELTPAGGGTWTEKVLYSFGNGTDGTDPAAGLIFDAAGNLYGTTYQGGTEGEGTAFEFTNTPAVPYQFVTMPPCRLVDTRQIGGPITGGTFRTFPIPQEGGCNIPATATAYSLNVTVVPMGFLGYITMWPAGIDLRPVVSTVNSPDRRVKADAAIVPAGTNGGVNVYATNTTNVILDINGYFAPVMSGR